MTPIHMQPITDPMAWRGSDFRSKDEIAIDLGTTEIGALRDVVARTAGMPLESITPEQFRRPALEPVLRAVYEEVIRGRGLVLLRGIPVQDHPVEEVERMFWAIVGHLGPHLSQNSFGHRMVRVQEEPLPGGVQPARGTKSRAELAMHNDSGDIFALLCVSQAKHGGESQFSSGPAAHNTILARRPDLLPILYRGFPQHRRSEQQDHQPAVTPYDVPVFSAVDGRVSLNFTYSSIIPALHELGRSLGADEKAALELLREVLFEQQFEIRMDPGEASIANNYAMCHSRSDFVDGNRAEEKRLVLRAWAEVPLADRRLPIGREYFLMENAGGRLGYDPVPGREGRIARNDYNDVPEELARLFKETQAKPRPKTGAGA